MRTVRSEVVNRFNLGKRPRWRAVWRSLDRQRRSEIMQAVMADILKRHYAGVNIDVLYPENPFWTKLAREPFTGRAFT